MTDTFSELNLCPELQFQVQELGYDTPTPIQSEAIPAVLNGSDLIAEAQTGTGKTAAFALPIIHELGKSPSGPEYYPIRGLVLVPTRELAVQVSEAMLTYGKSLNMRVIAIYGGVRFDNQIRKMKRGADILVATPGRLLEMLRQKKFSLEKMEILVLDEADRMLDLGFIHDIKKIIRFTPEQRQTLLFSATFNQRIDQLADELLTDPVHLKVATRNTTKASIQQMAYAVDNGQKSDVLTYLITEGQWKKTIVFTRTKRRAEQLCQELQAESISSASIHGDKNQKERLLALNAFIEEKVDILVATDVAARGLDIDALPRVVNYDIPQQAEDYIHRIGRTGRAGSKGIAISFMSQDEKRLLADIEELIGQKIKLSGVPRFDNGRWIDTPLPSKTKPATKRNSKRKPSKAKSSKHTAPRAPSDRSEVPQKPKRSAARRSIFNK